MGRGGASDYQLIILPTWPTEGDGGGEVYILLQEDDKIAMYGYAD